MKTCPLCHIEKELSEFSRDKSKADGLQSYCKICSQKGSSKYHKENRTRAKKRYHAWYLKYQEQKKSNASAYYYEHRAMVLAKRKQLYEKKKAGGKVSSTIQIPAKDVQGPLQQKRCKHLLLPGQCALCAGEPQRGGFGPNVGDGVDREFELFV